VEHQGQVSFSCIRLVQMKSPRCSGVLSRSCINPSRKCGTISLISTWTPPWLSRISLTSWKSQSKPPQSYLRSATTSRLFSRTSSVTTKKSSCCRYKNNKSKSKICLITTITSSTTIILPVQTDRISYPSQETRTFSTKNCLHNTNNEWQGNQFVEEIINGRSVDILMI